jgi:rubrerythrin
VEDFSIKKALQLAVKTEQMGADYYEKMAGKFADLTSIANVFKQLAIDEKVHWAQFKKVLDTIPAEAGESNYEPDQFFRAIAISEFFRIEQFKNANHIETVEDALGAALAFEKSTLLFYQELKNSLGKGEQLDSVIKAEREHVYKLTKVILTDGKFRGIRDSWTG